MNLSLPEIPPSALASAIIGKTPNYGVHQPENRKPNIMIDVLFQPRNEVEYGALGYYVGGIVKDKIPVVKGLRKASPDELKQFGAALASSGMASMFHYKREPENIKELEVVAVERKEVEAIIERLSSSKFKPDMIFIGCPHCSLQEIEKLASLIQGKKLQNKIEFWICTSKYIKNKAKEYIKIIESSGAKVLTDTCAVVTWTDKLGIKKIATNSVKAAHYLPTMNKAEVLLASMEECVKIAYK